MIKNSVMSDHKTSERAALQIGLTGSIGMGKSTISGHFKAMGFLVFDSDAIVHKLYSVGGGAVDPISKVFPSAVVDGVVNRSILSKMIADDGSILKVLENIVYPLVVAERQKFYKTANDEGHFLVVYDIPMLLENPTHQEVDYVVVVTASADTQRTRVMKRPGMTEDKFLMILNKQLPDAKKRELADFIVHTDYKSMAPGKAQVAQLVENLINKHPERWLTWRNTLSWKTNYNSLLGYDKEDIDHASTIDRNNINDNNNMNFKSLSKDIKHENLANYFDIVVFDLDDTLVPVWDPIKPATEALWSYMTENMPKTLEIAKLNIRTVMADISNNQVLLAHDLTEIRKEALKILSEPFGESDKVEEAMQVSDIVS